MSFGTVSLIGFCVLMFVLVLYFCFWAHRKATILSATSYSTPPTFVLRQRYGRNIYHHRQGRCGRSQPTTTTVYTIPVTIHSTRGNTQHCVPPPPPYGQYWARPSPQILLVTASNADLPPSYDEVTGQVTNSDSDVDVVNTNSVPPPPPANSNMPTNKVDKQNQS